jgi:hypothetical protein
MIRQGGLFIACVGLALIVGTLAARFTGQTAPVLRPVFLVGVAIGLVALFGLGHRLALGRPTRTQLLALGIGLGLEGALLAVLPLVLGPVDLGTFWLAVLIVVGFHFLPLAVAFGGRCAMLGTLCMALAAFGLMVQASTGARVFIVVDGTLKTLVGLSMAVYPFGMPWGHNKRLQPTSGADAAR